MRLKLRFVGVALLAMPALAYAQSPVVGTWTGESQSPGGLRSVTVVINSDGTGTFNAGDNNELSDVVIDGANVSFSFKPIAAGGALTFHMVGKVDGDTLTLVGTIEGGGSGPPLVLHRQK